MTKKIIIITFSIICLFGCGIQNQPIAPRGNPPSVIHTQNDGKLPSDEDVIIGAKNHITLDLENQNTKKDFYSKEEAKQLVRNHLKLKKVDAAAISFEGFEGDQYIFHVSGLKNNDDRQSMGWYKVNPQTGNVTSIQK